MVQPWAEGLREAVDLPRRLHPLLQQGLKPLPIELSEQQPEGRVRYGEGLVWFDAPSSYGSLPTQ